MTGCTVIPFSMHPFATATPPTTATDSALRIKGYSLDKFPVFVTELTHSDRQPSTLTLTVTDSLELPISPMRKSPDCRRKLELQERTHPRRGTETTCKHQEGPRPN